MRQQQMSSQQQQPTNAKRTLGQLGHAPLRRAGPVGQQKQQQHCSTERLRSEHPLLFSCSSSSAAFSFASPPNAAGVVQPPSASTANRQHRVAAASNAAATTTTVAASRCPSLADSCYSSGSEGDHLALSRETSGSQSSSASSPAALGGSTLAEEFARGLAAEDDESASGGWEAAIGGGTTAIEPALLDFATRLGYTEEQLRTVLSGGVLREEGECHQQDRVLAELIKLGQRERRRQSENVGAVDTGGSKTLVAASADANVVPQQQQQQPKLRPIVIDGSNLAMTFGNKAVFSCQGIRQCVDFFLARGHTEILVFVPQFRREQARPDCPIVDQHILMQLEAEQRLIWTPSRRVGGRRIVCHDDRYILKTAAEKEAVVVSNDEYRDLVRENAHWRSLVESRLLMYSFVDGKFMPPDDPLGRRGPSLDQFLTFAHTAPNAQPCPYGRKCTYGNKCKFLHPERTNGLRVSVTDRLVGSDSSLGGGCGRKQSATARGPRGPSGSQQQREAAAAHSAVGRTRSLNLPPLRGGPLFDHPPLAADGTPLLLGPPPPLHSPLARIVSAPAPRQLGGHMFTPSVSVWGECEFSLNPSPACSSSSFVLADNGGSSSTAAAGPAFDELCPDRSRLHYHLSQLFAESTVAAVMGAHPREQDPQRLCQRIIAFQRGFQQQLEMGQNGGGGGEDLKGSPMATAVVKR